jgi:hypothetical protein
LATYDRDFDKSIASAEHVSEDLECLGDLEDMQTEFARAYNTILRGQWSDEVPELNWTTIADASRIDACNKLKADYLSAKARFRTKLCIKSLGLEDMMLEAPETMTLGEVATEFLGARSTKLTLAHVYVQLEGWETWKIRDHRYETAYDLDLKDGAVIEICLRLDVVQP